MDFRCSNGTTKVVPFPILLVPFPILFEIFNG